jgi:hypothetical protein
MARWSNASDGFIDTVLGKIDVLRLRIEVVPLFRITVRMAHVRLVIVRFAENRPSEMGRTGPFKVTFQAFLGGDSSGDG